MATVGISPIGVSQGSLTVPTGANGGVATVTNPPAASGTLGWSSVVWQPTNCPASGCFVLTVGEVVIAVSLVIILLLILHLRG